MVDRSLIVLLIFGGSQLPKLAKNLGKAQKEFKDGLSEGSAEKPDSEKTPEELAAELAAARKEAADAKAQARLLAPRRRRRRRHRIPRPTDRRDARVAHQICRRAQLSGAALRVRGSAGADGAVSRRRR